MPRIITLLCLHLSQRLHAFQSTHKTFIGLTLSSFWSPSSTLSLALNFANCTGTIGLLSDWPQIALGPLHTVLNNTSEDFKGLLGRRTGAQKWAKFVVVAFSWKPGMS